MQTLDVSLSTRWRGKVSSIVNISRIATRACECLEVSRWPIHFLITSSIQQVCLFLRQTPASKKSRAAFLCGTNLQDPPLTPTATTVQRKGWRSSRRSAQRCRATELCPHRLASQSIFLTTWWRGTKDMNIADNAHTIRAQSHGNGSCCATQTAVVSRSCYDTCVLRLTRVRARPYARLSVSRVCTMSYVTEYAIFSGPSR